MMKLVILITPDTERSLEVADKWQGAGAPGVSLIDAHGVQGLRRQKHDHAPELSLAVSMSSILHDLQKTNTLVFSVVDSALVETLIGVAEEVIGDLAEPENGILFILDVERVVGIPKRKTTS